MRRREIAFNFDEITDFPGIGRFVDVPVKRYSSGTYARPAFAVSAHLEPEMAVWRTAWVRRWAARLDGTHLLHSARARLPVEHTLDLGLAVSVVRRIHSIDVVVTTHDGWELTERCLRHLRAQTIAHTVIVSDGASTDGTPENIRALFPEVALVAHANDPGYATATNHGVAAGSGEMILLLNNDAFCRPNFLEHVLESFQSDERVGAVAPVTVRSDERTIDSVGLTLDVTLAPFIRLNGRPIEEARSRRPILVSPGGGADAYRRSAWIEAGGFDERLSFYGADLDLGLRIRSLGWTTVAAPKAIAVHLRSATSGHRSPRARESGGWARGFLLRRWSVLRSRALARALVTEALVAIADTALSRDTVAFRSRISGWRCAGGLPRRSVPPGAVDPDIGFVESLRLRWAVR
jgi:N-acetylglucosaminyl-diphospho-decaprenol L-rhamnosyltransferase